MSAAPASRDRAEREWWLRAALALQSPRAVFAALRDDSPNAAAARQEPVLAIVLLAGVAGVLMTSVAARLLDDPDYDGLVVAVYVFLAGLIHGVVGYFLLGGLLFLGASFAGSLGSYRRARHLVAFAAAPLALTLLLWPVRLALYGGDLFRRGGSDAGAGDRAFEALSWLAVGWSLALLAVGVRAVEGWSMPRTLAAVALPALLPALALAQALGVLGEG